MKSLFAFEVAVRVLETAFVLTCLSLACLWNGGLVEHEKLRREVIVFSVPGCRDCDTWKRVEQPKFEADGWVVATSDDPGNGPWPYFIVERNGSSTEHRAYLPFEKVNEVTK